MNLALQDLLPNNKEQKRQPTSAHEGITLRSSYICPSYFVCQVSQFPSNENLKEEHRCWLWDKTRLQRQILDSELCYWVVQESTSKENKAMSSKN